MLNYLKSAKEIPVFLNCARKKMKSTYYNIDLDF